MCLFPEQLELEKCSLGVGENVDCRKTFFFIDLSE